MANRSRKLMVTGAFVLLCPCAGMLFAIRATAADPGAGPTPHRVYGHLLEPREHPDYNRHAAKPPTWETFGNRTHLITLRQFRLNQSGDLAVGYVEDLDQYTRQFELGDVLWPLFDCLRAKNLGDVVREIERRHSYLFDIWGYIPGGGPGAQFQPSPETLKMFESKLGDHWLGMDTGEQDGRYIGLYAKLMTPASADRRQQYFNFQRFFEGMEDDLGQRLTMLMSLSFGHYALKQGSHTLLGAETAQGLPNGQLFYAFIRGAGKQYGVPWFGNVSVYNRWGYKNCTGAAGGTETVTPLAPRRVLA